jgi:predicted nucleic acid-binding protein
VKFIFDTNIFIYHFNGQLPEPGVVLLKEGISGQGAYSVMTRIEVLGFRQSQADDTKAQRFLSRLAELSLTSEIAERTILLRKRFRIKIPDAIIAATALEYSLQLVSRNEEDFYGIEHLNLLNPFNP